MPPALGARLPALAGAVLVAVGVVTVSSDKAAAAAAVAAEHQQQQEVEEDLEQRSLLAPPPRPDHQGRLKAKSSFKQQQQQHPVAPTAPFASPLLAPGMAAAAGAAEAGLRSAPNPPTVVQLQPLAHERSEG